MSMLALAFLTEPQLQEGTSAWGQLSRTRQRHDHHIAVGAADLIALTAREIRRLLLSAPSHAAPMAIARTGHVGAATSTPAPENPSYQRRNSYISACGCSTSSGCHVDRLRGRGVCSSRPCWLAGRDQLGALERQQNEEAIRSRLGRS